MVGALAFLLALAKLLLGALIAWGVLLMTPLDDWKKRVGELLLAAIVIFALLLEMASHPVVQGNLPFPLNPSSPSNPSAVR